MFKRQKARTDLRETPLHFTKLVGWTIRDNRSGYCATSLNFKVKSEAFRYAREVIGPQYRWGLRWRIVPWHIQRWRLVPVQRIIDNG